MSDFSLAPKAQADLYDIWEYLGVQKGAPAAAQRQIEMLFGKFSLLAANPLLGELRPDLGPHLRSFVGGNYVVVYRVGEEQIEIIHVAHASRDIRSLFYS